MYDFVNLLLLFYWLLFYIACYILFKQRIWIFRSGEVIFLMIWIFTVISGIFYGFPHIAAVLGALPFCLLGRFGFLARITDEQK